MLSLPLRSFILVLGLLASIAPVVSAEGLDQTDEGKKLVELVDRATKLIGEKGEAAFEELRKEGSEWRHDETYIFIVELDGIVIFHASNPAMEKTNITELKDVDGKEFIKTMIEDAKTSGTGWVDYKWPKPGQTEPARKISYIEKGKLGEKDVFIGAGIYLKDEAPPSPAAP